MARLAAAGGGASSAASASSSSGYRPDYPSSSLPERDGGLMWPVPGEFAAQEATLAGAAPGCGASSLSLQGFLNALAPYGARSASC
eukprot:15397941-Heterocapsa_arctica.AAC.1